MEFEKSRNEHFKSQTSDDSYRNMKKLQSEMKKGNIEFKCGGCWNNKPKISDKS